MEKFTNLMKMSFYLFIAFSIMLFHACSASVIPKDDIEIDEFIQNEKKIHIPDKISDGKKLSLVNGQADDTKHIVYDYNTGKIYGNYNEATEYLLNCLKLEYQKRGVQIVDNAKKALTISVKSVSMVDNDVVEVFGNQTYTTDVSIEVSSKDGQIKKIISAQDSAFRYLRKSFKWTIRNAAMKILANDDIIRYINK